MASWDSILKEVTNLNRPDGFDVVRRQKLARVEQVTGRHLLIYASDFGTQDRIKAQFAGGMMIVTIMDKDGFDEVTRNIPKDDKGLDVFLHSPGGSAEATESIVALLRDRCASMRFIVPNIAKSAATMMAMSGDQILMDERSELGPIDPQLIISRDNQLIAAPAQAIKDQFKKAQDDINTDPNKLPSWVPILREYGPSLLAECDNHLALAETLVSTWLKKYMLASDVEAASKATVAAKFLNNHNNFHSHSRRVGITELQALGLNILDMRQDPQLHEAVRELYTALMVTFSNTGAYKIFENGCGEALIQQIQMQQVPIQTQLPNRTPQQNRPSKRRR